MQEERLKNFSKRKSRQRNVLRALRLEQTLHEDKFRRDKLVLGLHRFSRQRRARIRRQDWSRASERDVRAVRSSIRPIAKFAGFGIDVCIKSLESINLPLHIHDDCGDCPAIGKAICRPRPKQRRACGRNLLERGAQFIHSLFRNFTEELQRDVQIFFLHPFHVRAVTAMSPTVDRAANIRRKFYRSEKPHKRCTIG